MKNKQRISILSCGWLGGPLAISLQQEGYTLKGATTSAGKLSFLQENHIEPFLLTIDEKGITGEIKPFLQSDILIVNLPPRGVLRTTEPYEQLFAYLTDSPVKHVVLISSTSVYPETNGWVSEDFDTSRSVNPIAAIENVFRTTTSVSCTVLRMAGLFGPGRHPGNFFRRSGSIQAPDAPVNLIHQVDCIGIIEKIIEQGSWNEVFNCCADTHPSKREFYTRAIVSLNNPLPHYIEQEEYPYKIVSNQKVKEVLNYSFTHGDLMAIPEDKLGS